MSIRVRTLVILVHFEEVGLLGPLSDFGLREGDLTELKLVRHVQAMVPKHFAIDTHPS